MIVVPWLLYITKEQHLSEADSDMLMTLPELWSLSAVRMELAEVDCFCMASCAMSVLSAATAGATGAKEQLSTRGLFCMTIGALLDTLCTLKAVQRSQILLRIAPRLIKRSDVRIA